MSFKSFGQMSSSGTFVNMASLSENKALRLMDADSGRQFLQHTARQLTRIYPAGSRVDSSNYDPIPMWMVGCQVDMLEYICLIRDFVKALMNSRNDWIGELELELGLRTNNPKPNFYFSHFTNLLVISQNT